MDWPTRLCTLSNGKDCLTFNAPGKISRRSMNSNQRSKISKDIIEPWWRTKEWTSLTDFKSIRSCSKFINLVKNESRKSTSLFYGNWRKSFWISSLRKTSPGLAISNRILLSIRTTEPLESTNLTVSTGWSSLGSKEGMWSWLTRWVLGKPFKPWLFLIIFIIKRTCLDHFWFWPLYRHWLIGRSPLRTGLIWTQSATMTKKENQEENSVARTNGLEETLLRMEPWLNISRLSNSMSWYHPLRYLYKTMRQFSKSCPFNTSSLTRPIDSRTRMPNFWVCLRKWSAPE